MMPGVPVLVGKVDPVGHVVNQSWWTVDGWWLWSSHVGTLVLAGIILMILGPWVARRIGAEKHVTRNKFAHVVEVICIYLRENTVRPMLHERTERYMPYLWTLFFFILVNNLLGLVPILDIMHLVGIAEGHSAPVGGTATQNLFVTAVLATISFLVINISGMKQLGVGGYLKHLTGGAPMYIWPILVPVEILGTFIKPVALALRLFANMTAGHILLATMFAFVGMSLAKSLMVGVPVTLISAVAAVLITFLELFVAFLQAYVFMFLTTVFVAQLSHHGDDHAHGPAHEHGVPHEVEERAAIA